VAWIRDDLPMTTAIRASLAALAVAAGAWFVLGWFQARDTQRATTLLAASSLSPAQARQTESLLDSAGTLNPDLTVDILRGKLAADRNENAQAVRILQSVTSREPLNLTGWVQLAFIAERAGDKTIAAAAFAEGRALLPPVN
jgi:predicted Zn-dependent protease